MQLVWKKREIIFSWIVSLRGPYNSKERLMILQTLQNSLEIESEKWRKLIDRFGNLRKKDL